MQNHSNVMTNPVKRVLLTMLVWLPAMAFAQVKQPAKWNFSAKNLGGGNFEIHLTAILDQGWHVYSQNTPDGGPVPTAIAFTRNPLVTLNGKAKEVGKLEKKHEPLFGVDVLQYSNSVDFVQVVKVKPGVNTSVTGSVEYMLCNEKSCLPPAKSSFNIALK